MLKMTATKNKNKIGKSKNTKVRSMTANWCDISPKESPLDMPSILNCLTVS